MAFDGKQVLKFNQMATLVARVRQGKVIRTINRRTTDEKIIELRKALGLNLKQEAKRFAIKVDMGWITLCNN